MKQRRRIVEWHDSPPCGFLYYPRGLDDWFITSPTTGTFQVNLVSTNKDGFKAIKTDVHYNTTPYKAGKSFWTSGKKTLSWTTGFNQVFLNGKQLGTITALDYAFMIGAYVVAIVGTQYKVYAIETGALVLKHTDTLPNSGTMLSASANKTGSKMILTRRPFKTAPPFTLAHTYNTIVGGADRLVQPWRAFEEYDLALTGTPSNPVSITQTARTENYTDLVVEVEYNQTPVYIDIVNGTKYDHNATPTVHSNTGGITAMYFDDSGVKQTHTIDAVNFSFSSVRTFTKTLTDLTIDYDGSLHIDFTESVSQSMTADYTADKNLSFSSVYSNTLIYPVVSYTQTARDFSLDKNSYLYTQYGTNLINSTTLESETITNTGFDQCTRVYDADYTKAALKNDFDLTALSSSHTTTTMPWPAAFDNPYSGGTAAFLEVKVGDFMPNFFFQTSPAVGERNELYIGMVNISATSFSTTQRARFYEQGLFSPLLIDRHGNALYYYTEPVAIKHIDIFKADFVTEPARATVQAEIKKVIDVIGVV